MPSLAVLLAVPLLFVGCATRRPATLACAQRDWFEIGRHDGAEGARENRVVQYHRECGGHLDEHQEALYTNGRRAGLVEYCQPASAFQIGRAGQPYLHVCPEPIEGEFLASYRRGQRAREVEQHSRDLDVQIEGVSSRLLRADDPALRRRLSAELERLERAKARVAR